MNKETCPRCERMAYLIRVERQVGMALMHFHCPYCRWIWIDAEVEHVLPGQAARRPPPLPPRRTPFD